MKNISGTNKNKYSNLKKIIAIVFAIPFLILTLYITYIISVHYINFQKVYNSYEDKKLAQNIENKLEKMAKKVLKTKKTVSINIDELTEDKEIDKLCVAGPYYPDINKLIGVNWKQSKLWERNVVYYDSLFSIFLIYGNNVIPIKIKRVDINKYITNQSCISSNNDIILELVEYNSNVYLRIKN